MRKPVGTFVEALTDNQGGIDGLDGAYAVTVSPDGKNVYVAGEAEDAVAVFARNANTGRLTFVQVLKQGLGGVAGLDGVRSLAVSPTGSHLYVAAEVANAVAVFARDQDTGRLTFIEALVDEQGGINGLGEVRSVTVSPDGRHVYAAAKFDDSVTVFVRDDETGRLTLIQELHDGQDGVDGLNRVYQVIVSPDGNHVYAVSPLFENAVVTFARDVETGRLTFVEVLRDGQDGVEGLDYARSVAISPNGNYVYVAGQSDNAVAEFTRDPNSGRLSFVQVLVDGQDGVDGLGGVGWVTVSPDNRNVYAAGELDNAVAAFANDTQSARPYVVNVGPGDVRAGLDFGNYRPPGERRLNPVGGLMVVDRSDVVQIDAPGSEARLSWFVDGGQTLAAIVTPHDPDVVLSVMLENIGSTFTAPGPGLPVVLPPQAIPSAGTYTVVVTGDVPTTFSLEMYRNAALEALIGDSTDANVLPIDDSRIDVGGWRFGVIGHADGSDSPDVDVYSLDLTGSAGHTIDVVLAGQADADFSAEMLQLFDAEGTVLATAVNDPLGVRASNFDLAILDFTLPADGIYTLRFNSTVEGEYGIVVTDSIALDSEPNGPTASPLRKLDVGDLALGYLGEVDSEELLLNGSFETGDFTGWTAKSNGFSELTPWTVGPADGGFFFNSSPLEGTYSAYNGFDGAADLYYELYQDVTIPADSLFARLTTNHRIVYTNDGTATRDRTLGVYVLDTAGNLLERLHGESLSSDVVVEVDTGWNTYSFDLSAYIGSTIRIYFDEDIPHAYAGPAMFELDDISLIAGVSNDDWYEIQLAAGDAITVSTRTPLDHPDQPSPNELDPALWVYDPAGELIASNADAAADGRNALLDLVAAEAGTYRIRISAESGQGEYVLRVDAVARVVDRKIFYNSSKWDENDAAPQAIDDMAIAADKRALLPEQTATSANYTNYDKGINGLMIDVAGLADAAKLSAAKDFAFHVGNDDSPDTWAAAAAPESFAVRQGAGVYGSDRITITWADNAIENQWLQVTVLATKNTGLLKDDIFYFGSAPGEAGNSPINTIVNADDEIAARNFQHGAADPAPIGAPYDYNRDGLVNGTDQIIARNNQTNPLTMLKLIAAPAIDLALKQAAVEDQVTAEALAAALDWQYEYESMRSKRAKSNDVEATVDLLLATDWA